MCIRDSVFPDDLIYSSKHEWVRQGAGSTVRIGITDYAAEALGDVVYVALPQVGEEVAVDDACAEVESTKSVSDVYSPATGVVTAVNELLNSSPETINSDPYGCLLYTSCTSTWATSTTNSASTTASSQSAWPGAGGSSARDPGRHRSCLLYTSRCV